MEKYGREVVLTRTPSAIVTYDYETDTCTVVELPGLPLRKSELRVFTIGPKTQKDYDDSFFASAIGENGTNVFNRSLTYKKIIAVIHRRCAETLSALWGFKPKLARVAAGALGREKKMSWKKVPVPEYLNVSEQRTPRYEYFHGVVYLNNERMFGTEHSKEYYMGRLIFLMKHKINKETPEKLEKAFTRSGFPDAPEEDTYNGDEDFEYGDEDFDFDEY